MLLDETYRQIANEFIGDVEDSLYSYKTGLDLVSFFNHYFNADDKYYRGFPSRWLYVVEHLKEISNNDNLRQFFSVVLSSKFLRVYENCSRSTIDREIEKRIQKFNKILDKEDLYINLQNGEMKIMRYEENELGTFIDSGGFADVYRVNENTAKKMLKKEFINDKGIKHRFRREYELAKEYENYDNIIQVESFDSAEFSYKMNYCEYNLHDFIVKNDLSLKVKLQIILEIVEIVAKLHKNNIIHRDLSPFNILINNNVIYLSDFGIAKDMDKKYSHLTHHTKGIGNMLYTSPEQIESLVSSSKESDVYSLGRIINFIFNKSVQNFNHVLQSQSTIACLDNKNDRYKDAIKMYEDISEAIENNSKEDLRETMIINIQNQKFGPDLNNFFLSLETKELIDVLMKTPNSSNAFINLLSKKPSVSSEILRKINYHIKTGYAYENYDKFSHISVTVLENELKIFDYSAQLEAARLLYYVANTINRFNAQDKIEKIIIDGVDPTIERVLNEGNYN